MMMPYGMKLFAALHDVYARVHEGCPTLYKDITGHLYRCTCLQKRHARLINDLTTHNSRFEARYKGGPAGYRDKDALQYDITGHLYRCTCLQTCQTRLLNDLTTHNSRFEVRYKGQPAGV